MKILSIIACCLSLLISISSYADVKIRLMYDGTPYVLKAKPEFACLDDGKQQWFECALTPTRKPGEYLRKSLAPGSYTVLFDVDENRNSLCLKK